MNKIQSAFNTDTFDGCMMRYIGMRTSLELGKQQGMPEQFVEMVERDVIRPFAAAHPLVKETYDRLLAEGTLEQSQWYQEYDQVCKIQQEYNREPLKHMRRLVDEGDAQELICVCSSLELMSLIYGELPPPAGTTELSKLPDEQILLNCRRYLQENDV